MPARLQKIVIETLMKFLTPEDEEEFCRRQRFREDVQDALRARMKGHLLESVSRAAVVAAMPTITPKQFKRIKFD